MDRQDTTYLLIEAILAVVTKRVIEAVVKVGATGNSRQAEQRAGRRGAAAVGVVVDVGRENELAKVNVQLGKDVGKLDGLSMGLERRGGIVKGDAMSKEESRAADLGSARLGRNNQEEVLTNGPGALGKVVGVRNAVAAVERARLVADDIADKDGVVEDDRRVLVRDADFDGGRANIGTVAVGLVAVIPQRSLGFGESRHQCQPC